MSTPMPLAASATSRPRAPATPRPHVDRLLRGTILAWLFVAIAGQSLFAAYIAFVYGRGLVLGRPELWNHLAPHAWAPGRYAVNTLFAAHMALAVVVTLGGMLQLLPAVRRRAPALHRWSGRVYLVAALLATSGGFAMGLVLMPHMSPGQRLGSLGNVVAVLACGTFAWRAIRARRVDAHRRWAVRLWLAVNASWFFRIALMAWIALNGGPRGFDPKTFEGPFLTFLTFGQYLVPIAVWEAVTWARTRGAPWARGLAAAGMAAATAYTAVGIAVAAAGLWWPHVIKP